MSESESITITPSLKRVRGLQFPERPHDLAIAVSGDDVSVPELPAEKVQRETWTKKPAVKTLARKIAEVRAADLEDAREGKRGNVLKIFKEEADKWQMPDGSLFNPRSLYASLAKDN